MEGGCRTPHPLDGRHRRHRRRNRRFARPLSTGSQTKVIAVEPATGMRSARTDPDADVAWVAGAAEALPLSAASTGLEWSAFTTHYLDLVQAAAEIARVLRPCGRALIWHAFPDVFDDLEWFRWFPTARAIDEQRMPSASSVQRAFEAGGLAFTGRSDHATQITPDLAALADRLAHRSISTLRRISDDEFHDGLARLRAAAADHEHEHAGPVVVRNVMLRFDKSD